jgi:hypothetical protein
MTAPEGGALYLSWVAEICFFMLRPNMKLAARNPDWLRLGSTESTRGLEENTREENTGHCHVNRRRKMIKRR